MNLTMIFDAMTRSCQSAQSERQAMTLFDMGELEAVA